MAANSATRLAGGPIGTGSINRFTVPTGVNWKLTHIYLANTTGAPISVSVNVTTTLGVVIHVMPAFSVPANTPVPIDMIVPLLSGDVVSDSATAAGCDISYAVELD